MTNPADISAIVKITSAAAQVHKMCDKKGVKSPYNRIKLYWARLERIERNLAKNAK